MAEIFTRRRSLPPHRDSSDSDVSRRDQVLARVDELLRDDSALPSEGEVVAPQPVAPAPEAVAAPPPLPPLLESSPLTSLPPSGHGLVKKSAPIHSVAQVLILLFVLSWVFILGVVVGRGHLGESGPIHDGIVWLEQKIGWQPQEEPLVVVREAAPDPREEVDWEEIRRLYQLQEAAEPQRSGQEVGLPAAGYQEPNAPSANDPPSLGYFDPNVPAPEQVTPEPVATAEQAVPEPAVPEQAAPETVVSAELVAVAEPAMPEPAAPPESQSFRPTEAAASEASASGRYAVQVALAFDEEEARRRVERLQSQGLPAYYYQTSVGRFPVRAGRFLTRPEAEAARDRLSELGYRDHYLSTLTD